MAYARGGCRSFVFEAGEDWYVIMLRIQSENMGYVGRVGMKDTDVTILNLMINQKKV